MLTALLEKVPVILAGILLLVAVVRIYLRARYINRAAFTGIFKTAKYFSLWTVIATLLFTGVFGVFHHLTLRKSAHATLSLNYSEASQALTSNGTRYNMAEIISDEVVKRAIEKGALEGVTVKALRDCLSVYPLVEGDVSDPSSYHISTEFAVEYHASRHTDHLDAENVIKLITSAYKEYYIETYTDNFRLDEEKPDFSKMEYMDIVAYLQKESTAVMQYLYGMAEKAPSFVTSNNATFNSIAGKVFQFKETQIEQNLKGLLLQNGVVRNREDYVDRLAYRNTNQDFDKQKDKASFDLCNDAIAMYAEEMTRIVLVPTWDETGKYYMGRTKVGVDELSVMATEFSAKVADSEKEMMDNKLIMDKMSRGSGDMSVITSADALIESIYQSIKAYEKEAITAGREFANYKMNQCIAVAVYGVSLMEELKDLAMFIVFAYLAVVLYSISEKFPKKA